MNKTKRLFAIGMATAVILGAVVAPAAAMTTVKMSKQHHMLMMHKGKTMHHKNMMHHRKGLMKNGM